MIKRLLQIAQSAGKLEGVLDALNGKVSYSDKEKSLIDLYSRQFGVPVSLNEAYRIEEAKSLCKACPGILQCREGGLELQVEASEGHLHFSYRPCKHRLKKIEAEKWAKACALAGLPDIYDALTPTDKQQAIIKAISESTNDWFYIYGGLASGKTLSAVLAAKVLIHNKSVRFFNTAELLSRLNPQSVQTTLDELMRPEVLILDDFGAQYKSEWSNDRLFMVVDGRYRKKGLTIFTSNYPLVESTDLMLARINDRIRRRANIICLNP